MSGVVYTPVPSLVPFFTSETFISLVVGPVGCVRGDTLILTEQGPTPIADITAPVRVLSWDAKTCRYRLSWCGGAFPKGKDYLYRVVTPAGEFVAAAQHRLLCADGEYRQVQSLRPGDVVVSCSGSQQLTSEELSRPALLADAVHCSETDVGYLEHYAALVRRYGLPALSQAADAPVSVQESVDAQISTLPDGPRAALRLGAQVVESPSRNLAESHDAQTQTGGCQPPAAPLHCGEVDHSASGTYGHYAVQPPVDDQSPLTCDDRQLTLEFAPEEPDYASPQSPPNGYTTTNRAILHIERLAEQAIYWDLSVHDTHNYVTVDGTVHHNSTKTTAGILKILFHAKKMAACRDGIRRSRCVWVRNTREQLRDTSIPDFLKWFPDGLAGTFAKTDYKFILRMDDVECEVLFRGLDDANDVRRLLSLQASFAVFDEFREINKDVFEAMQGRLGRYPDGMMVPHRPQWGVDDKGNPIQGCVTDDGEPNDHLWGMSNPPDYDTFWETLLNNPPDNTHVTIQPSGVSPEADWVHLLKSNYYENLMEGKTEEYIDVYIHAKFGKSLSGQPVYKNSFTRQFHVAPEALIPLRNASYPLIIGIDFGRTPAAVFKQRDPRGRVLTLSEITSENMGIETFIQQKLLPHMASRYPGFDFVCAPDPAGFDKQQLNEMTLVDALKAAGLKCVRPPTNKPDLRIQGVERLLGRQLDGKAMYLIDPGCQMLIKGFQSGYRYKIRRNGTLEDSPEKNEYSHVHDANQYADAIIDLNIRGVSLTGPTRHDIKPVRYAYT